MGGYSLENTSKNSSSNSEVEPSGMTGKYVGKVEPSEDSKSSSGSSSVDETKTEVKGMVGVFELFRFSTVNDRLLMLIGFLGACAHGAAMPMMMIVFGNVADTLIDQQKASDALTWVLQNITDPSSPFYKPQYENLTSEDISNNFDEFLAGLPPLLAGFIQDSIYGTFMPMMMDLALRYVYIGIAVLGVAYLQMMGWYMAAYNQSERIRTALFQSILKQDISWFDTHEVGELGSRLVDDVDQIENGIGDKIALFFQYFSTFIAGFVVGFIYGWQLTLVIVAVSPLLALCGGTMAKLIAIMTRKELAAYAKAGAVAEEVIGSIRTVTAFGGQQKEVDRYAVNLNEAKRVGLRKGLINGAGMGSVYLVLFSSYALAFWYGSSLVRSGDYTPGDMLIVFFSVLMGAFSIGAASPNIEDFSNARGAAHVVYSIIDQIPPIDSSSTKGLTPDKLIGNIEFTDVIFRYPSRPDIPILNGFSLKVNTGQTVALVGSSGCGKSTCIQLIQRFYDLLGGTVKIDGIEIKDFNLKWLRQRIGVVSQEPVLFGTTIAENIRYGREDVTMEEMEKAAREANAHDFITKLPLKYDTLVGERGAQLSGGQKQRIAIARALVRDPIILLLDEATSALDTESESTVQAALDKARMGRTTIVVAHRLSTIQTADIIVGVSNGVVAEQGTHAELMLKQGIYYVLVNNQSQMRNAEQAADEVNNFGPSRKLIERSLSHQSEKQTERKRTVSVSSNSNVATTKTKEKTEKEIMEEEELEVPAITRIMKLNQPEWPFIVIGCISACVMGLIQPAFAIIFSSILAVFSETDLAYQEQQCNLYSGLFAAIGGIAFVSHFGMFSMFGRSGEYLTTRLRTQAFSSLLRQEMAYFDDHRNGTGALCSRLSTDAAAVKGATGSRLASLIQSFASIGCGLIIGFIYSWKLTLVVLAFAPFMLLGGYIKMKIFAGSRTEKNLKMEQAAKVANEAIENMRTVANLTKEEKFYQIYCSLVAAPYDTSRRKAHMLGFAYSCSQSIIFFANAGCFAFGAWLVTNDGLKYENLFKVFTAIIFGAMAAGQASSFAPDYSKAKLSAARMFALFDRVPAIDSSSEAGLKLDSMSGAVELKDVQFTYPTRPDVAVLKGVSMTVKPGQMVALVGSSGCGKSTVIQLLERFYDPAAGLVMVDGHSTRDLHIQWLRRQIGIVSQEPILFDCSIRENIAYGDNYRNVTMDEIIAAAREANIHSFIEALPQGYETNVGDKGAQLSGGQKQRIAIARALIRSPKILLLDEATSALDTESEKVVQEALERAQKGRTSIVIAHRLSTIRNADCIIVIHNGLVAEVGTHDDLMDAKGYYYRLNSKQSNKRKEETDTPPPAYERSS